MGQIFMFCTGMLFDAKIKTAKTSTSDLNITLCCYFETMEQTLADHCLLLALLHDRESTSVV